MQQSPQSSADINAVIDELSSFLLESGGTLSQVYGFEAQEMEAVYAHAYSLYNQARWKEALKIFNFLVVHDHLERRYHVGQAACLQMLKRYDEALKAYGMAHVMNVMDPVVALHIAECLIAQGKKEDALIALESVVAITEDNPKFAELASRARALADLLRH